MRCNQSTTIRNRRNSTNHSNRCYLKTILTNRCMICITNTPRIVREIWFSSRSEEHTSELQSHHDLVCHIKQEKKKKKKKKKRNKNRKENNKIRTKKRKEN